MPAWLKIPLKLSTFLLWITYFPQFATFSAASVQGGSTYDATAELSGKTIDGADVALEDDPKQLLSLNPGETVRLLKSSNGSFTYTGATPLDRTHEATTSAGTATVTTTGAVAQNGDALDLNIQAVKYRFDLSADAKDQDAFLTSTNPGTTKIDGKDVTLVAKNDEQLALGKGETVYLLKDSAGTLSYTPGDVAPKLAHRYTTSDGAATVETTGTVAKSGNDLALTVDGVTYTFRLSSATKSDGTPLLTLRKNGTTKIDGKDVTLKTKGMLSFNADDTVTLLKKAEGGLTYSGSAEDAAYNYTYENSAKTASIQTAGTLQTNADGDGLVLHVDGVTYRYDLTSVMDGTTLLTSTNTDATKIKASAVKTTAEESQILSLGKGDTVCLLKSGGGTLTLDGAQDGLDHTYRNEAGTASIRTHGTVAKDGEDLVLNIDKVASRRSSRTGIRSSMPRTMRPRRSRRRM